MGSTFAGAPQAIKYQTIIRDNNGSVYASKSGINIKISILQNTAVGTVLYSELHSNLTTNSYGLINLEIGHGARVFGTFDQINWGDGPRFAKFELEIAGQTNGYSDMGTIELLSVPYALYAETSGSGGGGGDVGVDGLDVNDIPKYDPYNSIGPALVKSPLSATSTNEVKVNNEYMFPATRGTAGQALILSNNSGTLRWGYVSRAKTETLSNNAIPKWRKSDTSLVNSDLDNPVDSIIAKKDFYAKQRLIIGDYVMPTAKGDSGQFFILGNNGIVKWDSYKPGLWSKGTDFSSGIGRIYNTDSGFVGVGTATPVAPMHIQNGSFLATGTGGTDAYGALPMIGDGARMMWYANKAAFRVGAISGNSDAWDDNKIGYLSIGLGENTVASAAGSVAIGSSATASASNSYAIGSGAVVAQQNSLALGKNAKVNSGGGSGSNMAIGDNVIVNGSSEYSVAIGANSTVNGKGSIILGAGAVPSSSSSDKSVTIGYNLVDQSGTAANVGVVLIGAGMRTGTLSDRSVIIGYDQDVTSAGTQSVAIGYNNTTLKNNSVTIGSGNASNQATNMALGYSNSLAGNNGNNNAIGSDNFIDDGGKNILYGIENRIERGSQSVLIGLNSKIIAPALTNYQGNIVIGRSDTAYATNGVLIGLQNAIKSDSSVAIGYYNKINGAPGTYKRTFVIGRGIQTGRGDITIIGQGAGYLDTDNELNNACFVVTGNATGTKNAFFVNNNGSATFKGTVTATVVAPSDIRLKENIRPLTFSARKILDSLTPVQYNYIAYRNAKGEIDDQIGFIAQEVQQYFPELVKTDLNGFLSMNYTGLIPVLWKINQEQQHQLDAQQTQIDDLQNQINELKRLFESIQK